MVNPRPVVGTADIRRWDIYDVADSLADVPAMLWEAVHDHRVIPEILELVRDLEDRLWVASTHGGCIGPAPTYRKVW